MAIRSVEGDPLRNFKFRVDIAKTLRGGARLDGIGFMAASGLAATTEPISYREGGDNTTPRKMPGQTDFPPVSLTRGIVGNATQRSLLWNWHREIFTAVQGSGTPGNPGDFRAEVYIRVYGHPDTRPQAVYSLGHVKSSWKLYNAWPTSVAFSDLDAGGNGVLVNNLTLMYEGFDFASFEADDKRGSTNW
jgi:phage tail-like protein